MMDTSEPTFAPLPKAQSVAEQIAAEILDLLRQKELRPGDKLPPERELAEMLGVSRPSLREALRALSIMKVVEVRQGDGTYVTTLRPEDLVEHLQFVFLLDDSTLAQLFEARKIVEPGNVALAAARITPAELDELRALLAAAEAAVDDPEAFARADIALHERITAAARNPLLGRFMASIGTLSRASRQKTAAMPGVTAQTAAHHRHIVAALAAGDPAAAAAAMLAHLEQVETAYQRATAVPAPTPSEETT